MNELPPESPSLTGLNLAQSRQVVAHYEQLRDQVVGDPSHGLSGSSVEGLGWALLVRRGMAEWLRAWLLMGPRNTNRPSQTPQGGVMIPGIWTTEIASVWAGMATAYLEHHQEGIQSNDRQPELESYSGPPQAQRLPLCSPVHAAPGA